IGGIPEVVADGRNGLLFEPGNERSLADALSRLLQEPDLVERLAPGIPPVRTDDDDVREARRVYERCLNRTAEVSAVAAVVLNYQTPDQTLLTVRSLLASERRFSEIIVVDNAGADDSRLRSALSLHPAITYLPTRENLGYSGGMN